MSCRENGLKRLTKGLLESQGRNPIYEQASVLSGYTQAPKRKGRAAYNKGATELVAALAEEQGLALRSPAAKCGANAARAEEQTAFFAEQMARQGLFPPGYLEEAEKRADSPRARVSASVLRRYVAEYKPQPTPTQHDTERLERRIASIRHDTAPFSRELDLELNPLQKGQYGQQVIYDRHMSEHDEIHSLSKKLLWMRRRIAAVEREPRLAQVAPTVAVGQNKTIRLLHLTTEDNARLIKRNGLRSGSYAVPWTGNPQLDFEWMRELRKWGGRTKLVAVEIEVPATMPVRSGYYNGAKISGTAASAAGVRHTHEKPEGFEVITEQHLPASSVKSIKSLKQVYGWRHFPWAHGREPMGYSTKGEPNSRRLRKKQGSYTRGEELRMAAKESRERTMAESIRLKAEKASLKRVIRRRAIAPFLGKTMRQAKPSSIAQVFEWE